MIFGRWVPFLGDQRVLIGRDWKHEQKSQRRKIMQDVLDEMSIYQLFEYLEKKELKHWLISKFWSIREETDYGIILFLQDGKFFVHDSTTETRLFAKAKNISRETAKEMFRARASELREQMEKISKEIDEINQLFPS